MKIAGKKIGLSTQIFAAMLLGAVLGIVIGEPMTKVGFIGTIWLNCIKMIVVPMVLVTIMLSPHWLPAPSASWLQPL